MIDFYRRMSSILAILMINTSLDNKDPVGKKCGTWIGSWADFYFVVTGKTRGDMVKGSEHSVLLHVRPIIIHS